MPLGPFVVLDTSTREVVNYRYCGNCGEHADNHAEHQKCMFDSTYFTPRRHSIGPKEDDLWEEPLPMLTPKQRLESFKKHTRRRDR